MMLVQLSGMHNYAVPVFSFDLMSELTILLSREDALRKKVGVERDIMHLAAWCFWQSVCCVR